MAGARSSSAHLCCVSAEFGADYGNHPHLVVQAQKKLIGAVPHRLDSGYCHYGDRLCSSGIIHTGINARWSSFGFGLVLNLRPKSILLSAAAALSASTVAIPVIGAMVSPVKVEVWLQGARSWFGPNNRTVTILILLMIGVVIVGNGLTRL